MIWDVGVDGMRAVRLGVAVDVSVNKMADFDVGVGGEVAVALGDARGVAVALRIVSASRVICATAVESCAVEPTRI